MKIRVILTFTGPEAENISSSMQLGIMEITDIEFIGSGNYKAVVELSDDEYNEQFSDNLCHMVADYINGTGFNAEIKSCDIISTIYQRGGMVKKYSQGGTIDTELENNLKILQDIKHGNYPFIDSNDPEIQEALKGIDTEPTDLEIKELVDQVEKAIAGKVSVDNYTRTYDGKEYSDISGFEPNKELLQQVGLQKVSDKYGIFGTDGERHKLGEKEYKSDNNNGQYILKIKEAKSKANNEPIFHIRLRFVEKLNEDQKRERFNLGQSESENLLENAYDVIPANRLNDSIIKYINKIKEHKKYLKSEQPSVETVKVPEEKQVSDNEKIKNKLEVFRMMLEMAETKAEKDKIQNKIEVFEMMLE